MLRASNTRLSVTVFPKPVPLLQRLLKAQTTQDEFISLSARLYMYGLAIGRVALGDAVDQVRCQLAYNTGLHLM